MEFNYADDSQPDALQEALYKELEAFAEKFQDELSDDDKELLRMTRLNIKDDDIAVALGISRRTVINRRNKLKSDVLDLIRKYF